MKVENLLDDGKGFVELVDFMGSELSVVNAARVSFGKRKSVLDSSDEKLIKYLLVNKHSSPFEHITMTFHVKTPIFIARQWMRHRTQSFNEKSLRYTSDDIEFYLPSEFRKQSKSDRQASIEENIDENKTAINMVNNIYEECFKNYSDLLQMGVSREMARIILPVGLYTEFFTTMNLWNLFHFLNLRNDSHAQKEIQIYAKAIEEILENKIPTIYNIWKDYRKIKGDNTDE